MNSRRGDKSELMGNEERLVLGKVERFPEMGTRGKWKVGNMGNKESDTETNMFHMVDSVSLLFSGTGKMLCPGSSRDFQLAGLVFFVIS